MVDPVKVKHVNASDTDKVDHKDMLPKRGYHMTPQEYQDVENQPMEKPAFVKPGFGQNKDVEGKDTMPGFEGLESYKSAKGAPPGDGQGVYPQASKTGKPSIGK
jgi:hypothetical protein